MAKIFGTEVMQDFTCHDSLVMIMTSILGSQSRASGFRFRKNLNLKDFVNLWQICNILVSKLTSDLMNKVA